MADCVVIVPMLGRAAMVQHLANSLARTTDRARLLFVVSQGDVSVLDEVHGAYDYLLVPRWERGDYPKKINAGIASTGEPLVFTGAIDLVFHSGWLEAAEAQLGPGIGVVGTNDMANPRVMRGQHATHMLVTRAYAQGPQIDGKPGFLCEDYWHEFVDDEAVAVAKKRKAWKFAADSRVEHLAWQFGKRPRDVLDASYALRSAVSWRTFNRRRHLWT